MKFRLVMLFLVLIACSIVCIGQVKAETKDLNNLVAIAQLYSQNPNARGEEFVRSVDALRTPKLNNIVDALIAAGKGDKTILDTRFLKRPSDEELALWYVLREVHYNRTNENQKPRPDLEVAKETLGKKIDSRWLVDNYYYRIHGGIALLFNTADLSGVDIKLDDLGFRDDTERAIFFLNVMDSLAGGRFRVLLMTRNNNAILEFARKLPKFNGKPYYEYRKFDYPDFDWIGYEKVESYNQRHLGNFYVALYGHVRALNAAGDAKTAHDIQVSSILNEPKYFKYSELKDLLQQLYDSSK